jgi:hypothetical protein
MDNIRQELVNGTRDPLAEELTNLEEFKKPIPTKENPKINFEELKTVKGLPGFWLKAMQNNPHIKHTIEESDIPILKFLTNVREDFLEDNVRST